MPPVAIFISIFGDKEAEAHRGDTVAQTGQNLNLGQIDCTHAPNHYAPDVLPPQPALPNALWCSGSPHVPKEEGTNGDTRHGQRA